MQFLSILAFPCLALSPAAQNPRPYVPVSVPSAFGVEPGVASDGDLSAIYWNNAIGETILVSTSDGRGLAWSSPKRLDADATGANKAPETFGIAVAGNRIYAAWRDERYGDLNDEIFLNRSTDGGATWTGEVRIDKGYPVATGGVRDWRMAVSPGTPFDHVYFLMATDVTSAADEDLYLTASHDGGASFAAPSTPSSLPLGSADVDDIDLAADGLTVYAVWRDDRFGSDDEVLFQKSTNGGTSWLASDAILSAPLDGRDADDEVAIAREGPLLAVSFQEDAACCNVEELRAAVSSDGGGTWPPSKKVGTYATDAADVDMTPGALAVLPGGRVVVAWSDDRAGAPDVNEVYVASSPDGGVSWPREVKVSAATGGAPKLDARGDRVALAWADGGTVDQVAAAYSGDGGATWNPSLFLTTPAGQDIDDPALAYNDLYGNFVYAWLAGNLFNEVYAGGFRPQTLTPVGWVPGLTSAGFGMSAFTTDVPLAWVVVALSPGSFILPWNDGRNLGLGFDPVFELTVTLALSGLFATPLAPDGSGSTPLFPIGLPPGVTLHAAGIGIDIGVKAFGDITDIVAIQL